MLRDAGLNTTDTLFLQEIVAAATKHPAVQQAAAVSETECNRVLAELLPTITQERLDRQMRIFELYLGKPDARRMIDHHLCQAMYGQVHLDQS